MTYQKSTLTTYESWSHDFGFVVLTHDPVNNLLEVTAETPSGQVMLPINDITAHIDNLIEILKEVQLNQLAENKLGDLNG